MKQRRLRVLTLQGAVEKHEKLYTFIYINFGGTNNIFADCTTGDFQYIHLLDQLLN